MKTKIRNNSMLAWLLPLFIVIFSLFIGCDNPFIQEIVDPRKVTFESNGGSSVSAQTVFKNQPVRRPSDPSKSGYIFDAWYNDDVTFLEEWDFNVIPNGDITLYAKWELDRAISSVAVSVTPPSKGAAPDTAADGTGNFTIGAVSWSPSDNPFLGSTVYTASVTLTAIPDYFFAGNVTAAINGQSADVSNNTGAAVTLSFTFAPTEALAVTGMAVATQPSKLSYDYGDLLKLDGLAVTLTYEDGSTANVAFNDFASKNITTSPLNDAKLLLSHHGTSVVITCGGQTASTNNLTVTQKALTVTGASHGKTYDTTTAANGVSVTLSGKVGNDDVSASAVTAVYTSANAGTKTLTITAVTLAGNAAGNYTVTVPVNVEVTGGITKAAPTGITFPTATVTLGQTLANATLAGGIGDGTFTFNAPTYTPTEAESGNALPATFTPTDQNYTTLTGSIVVTVIEYDQTFTVYDLDTWNYAVTEINKTDAGTTFGINVTGDFSRDSNHSYTFSRTGINVIIWGNKTITLTSTGALLFINTDQTVTIRDLTLKGYASNTISLVYNQGGTFIMEGNAKVSDNTTNSYGAGVFVIGTFIMNGGEISNNETNSTSEGGGGVYVRGTFIMNDGVISNNKSTITGNGGRGGGVYIYSSGTISGKFIMTGGEISGNTANTYGGGIYVTAGTFLIVTGTVYGTGEGDDSNTATSGGAALYSTGTATQYGTFSDPADFDSTWIPANDANNGTLTTRNTTIRVVNGELQ